MTQLFDRTKLRAKKKFLSELQASENTVPVGEGHTHCFICHDDFGKISDATAQPERPIRLPCNHGHTVGSRCIIDWLQGRNTCPECDHEFFSADVNEVDVNQLDMHQPFVTEVEDEESNHDSNDEDALEPRYDENNGADTGQAIGIPPQTAHVADNDNEINVYGKTGLGLWLGAVSDVDDDEDVQEPSDDKHHGTKSDQESQVPPQTADVANNDDEINVYGKAGYGPLPHFDDDENFLQPSDDQDSQAPPQTGPDSTNNNEANALGNARFGAWLAGLPDIDDDEQDLSDGELALFGGHEECRYDFDGTYMGDDEHSHETQSDEGLEIRHT